ncbi:hypothetical protein [Acinetobacter pittii]|uniref:hypothetical protein n=1 Tax=Acinetobacter pittii TaxID=48296 RepID=UPI0008398534|nr:hypothetical protein [Acinetobacter pittii]OCY48716.1 hypothetical protein BFR81_18040 [Acinetobacter pittii]
MSNNNLNNLLISNFQNYIVQWNLISTQHSSLREKLIINEFARTKIDLGTSEQHIIDLAEELNEISIKLEKNKEIVNLTIKNGIFDTTLNNNKEILAKSKELDTTAQIFKSSFYIFENRIRIIIDNINILLNNNTPTLNNKNDLTTLSGINNIKSNLIALLNEANKTSKDLINYLDKLYTLLSEIISNVNSIIFKYDDFLEESYQKRFEQESALIFKKFQNSSDTIINNIRHELKNIEEDHKNSLNDYKLLKENFDSLEKNKTNLEEKIFNYNQKINNIIDEQYAIIKDNLDDKLNKLELVYEGKIKIIDDSYDKAQTNYEKFKDLVEQAGVYNLIVNYKAKSEEEKQEYKNYRNYTSYALYAAIGFTIFILGIPLVEHWGDTQPISIDYYPILVRLTISLMFLVLALFFSKQAAKHYECYQENNRTYLQLAALEPFMENMSPEDQLAIRKQLVPTYFNQNSDGKFASKGDEVDISSNIHSLLSQVINVMAEKKEQKPATNSSESNTSAK